MDRQAAFEFLSKEYPNLAAILNGTVSGHSTEWPMMRPELIKLVAAFAAIREECAKVAENRKQTKFSGLHDRQYIDGYLGACYDISEDIRNRTAQPAKAQEGA
jgi:hypothetical protein